MKACVGFKADGPINVTIDNNTTEPSSSCLIKILINLIFKFNT